MSKRNPISTKHRGKFVTWMSQHDCDELPDGAWFSNLEGAAEIFLEKHGIHGDRNSAAHQYLRLAYPEAPGGDHD